MSSAINETTMAARQPVLVDLALQGGGSHGAFTWGVLDRLLEESWIRIEAISGTSAGAMNAAVFAYGLAVDGREGARKALTGYWKRVSEAASAGTSPGSGRRPFSPSRPQSTTPTAWRCCSTSPVARSG